MKVERSDRGFEFLMHDAYLQQDRDEFSRLASQSSAIGNYDDAFDRPGSSFLWVGHHHHLNREQVAEFVKHLQHWLDTGYLTIGR